MQAEEAGTSTDGLIEGRSRISEISVTIDEEKVTDVRYRTTEGRRISIGEI